MSRYSNPLPHDTLVRLNSNLPCAIAVWTTGPSYWTHEIFQIGIAPLNGRFNLSDTAPVLQLDIALDHPQTVDYAHCPVTKNRLAEIAKNGLSKSAAVDVFKEWYKQLGITEFKRIYPVAYNWPLTSRWLTDLLGPLNFDAHFHWMYTDVLAATNYLADSHERMNLSARWPKFDKFYIANQLKMPQSVDSALEDAAYTATLYRGLLGKFT